MKLLLIGAVARNGAIGRDNGLVWRDASDLKHLRDTTMGHAVVMGRRTWDSLPQRFRPLPGRRNVVVSRSAGFSADGAEMAASLADALQKLAQVNKVFVIGGAQLYAQALPLADELVLTEIDADLPGDVFFPSWDRALFTETSRHTCKAVDGTHFHFVTYRRNSHE